VSAAGTRRRPRREVVDLGDRDWYRLPAWYDILHAAGTAWEVDGLEAIASRYVRCGTRGPMRWLEPACGTGRYLRVIARRGGRAIGFDESEAMVRYARDRAGRAGLAMEVFRASMESFAIPSRSRVEFAFNPINTVRHLASDDAMLTHLEAVAACLRRGGVYAVGLGTTAYGVEQPSEDVWRGTRGSARVTQIAQYLPAERRRRVERVVNHLVVHTPRREIHLDNAYDLRAYSGPEWLGLIDRSAMRLVEIVEEDGEVTRGGVAGGRWGDPGHWGYAVWVLAPRA
jgi:SAM-dependent methyltransferase